MWIKRNSCPAISTKECIACKRMVRFALACTIQNLFRALNLFLDKGPVHGFPMSWKNALNALGSANQIFQIFQIPFDWQSTFQKKPHDSVIVISCKKKSRKGIPQANKYSPECAPAFQSPQFFFLRDQKSLHRLWV